MATIKEQVNELLNSGSDCDGSGIECKFYRVTDKIGVKVYASRYSCNACYTRQCLLAEHGLAPNAYDTYSIIQNSREVYLYETEIVTTFCEYNSATGYRLSDDELEAIYAEHQNAFTELEEAIHRIGFDWTDGHHGNIGINDAGDYVCIDCSPVYMHHCDPIDCSESDS